VAPKLTPEEKLMDANGDKRVSPEERKAFRRNAPQAVASKWGVAYALITSLRNSDDPDAQSFAQWFDGQVRKYIDNPTGWSADSFKLEMNSQPWRQKYNSKAIEDMDLEAQFPELYAEQLNADVEALRDEAVQFGADIAEDELRELAKQKRRFGLTDAQMRNTLTDLATAKSGDFRGATGELQRSLREWSRRNGLSLTDNLVSDYVRRIQRGDMTEADVLQDLRRTYMAGAYPAWSDRIDSGYDIADIAAPYRERMARLLEVDDTSIDFNDPLLQKGLQGVGADGKPSVVPLYEFERQVREDPRWQYTDNAYATYTDVGTQLLQMFGFR
jgi:hypothetical protein